MAHVSLKYDVITIVIDTLVHIYMRLFGLQLYGTNMKQWKFQYKIAVEQEQLNKC